MPSIHWLGSQMVSLSPSQCAIRPCGSIGTLYSRGVRYSCSMRTGAAASAASASPHSLVIASSCNAVAGPRIVEARRSAAVFVVADLDQRGGSGRLLEGLGDDGGHMLAAEGDRRVHQRTIGTFGAGRAQPVDRRVERQACCPASAPAARRARPPQPRRRWRVTRPDAIVLGTITAWTRFSGRCSTA